MTNDSDYYREYDLIKARKAPSKINMAPHQVDANVNLMNWFGKESQGNHGGILVLPTGGGKTFTAVRFLCQGPLSEGYKVLWLAHTHHLLEQAYYSFGPREIDQQRGFEVGYIQEPRNKLNVRVVSGTQNHYRIQQVKSTDDVLICTLQTASSALKRNQSNFKEFLESAGEKLFVVFDEAHHSPAPSYRNLIIELRKKFSQMYLLGLTATPTYTDEKKKGWLKELFPDDILYQVTLNELMAQEILAKPIFENPNTEFEPDFDDREYEKWVNTFSDLPEYIIEQLANNRSRNQFIAKVYAKKRKKYGKTLIFADRWNQCVQLCEFLRKEGIKAGAMFTHVYQTGTGRIIGGDSNPKTLEKFRNDELEVLVNIRMLTEGTDVPDVDTVFLTRQTTSKILLTQMIGRSLRGPKFGGTEVAHIVSFVDSWNQRINWAEWDPLDESLVIDDGPTPTPKRPPWQLISIDLVRHLSQVMFNNQSMEIGPFLKNVPIGWYQTNFFALSEDNKDYEETSRLVMVFDNEKNDYEQFIDYLGNVNLSEYENEETTIESRTAELSKWSQEYFDPENSITDDLESNLFYIASHIGQLKEKPKFFEFEERKYHDMDEIARQYMNLKLFEVDPKLKNEFSRKDRYWRVIYPNFESFRQQFFACVQRLQDLKPEVNGVYEGFANDSGVLNPLRNEVIKRYPKCLSCGETNKKLLEVDHINPRYLGGKDSIDNFQTLCRYCNISKNVKEIDFRTDITPLKKPPEEFRLFNIPQSHILEDETWIKYIKRLINQFYCSSAVKNVILEDKEWRIELFIGNDPSWIRLHLKDLVNETNIVRNQINLEGPDRIIVV